MDNGTGLGTRREVSSGRTAIRSKLINIHLLLGTYL